MSFTLDFLTIFFHGVYLLLPLLALFCMLVMLLGQVVGKMEGWTRFDSFYWSFITAFTVGYGDIRPTKKASKVLSILIAILGIMFTGIVVAITVAAATEAFREVITLPTVVN